MKKKITLSQGSVLLIVLCFLIGVLFYAIAHDQMNRKINMDTEIVPESNVGEIIVGTVVEQAFQAKGEVLHSFTLYFQAYGRPNTGTLSLSLLDGDTEIYSTTLDLATVQQDGNLTFFPELTDLSGDSLVLCVTSPDCQPGNAVTLACGTGISAGRGTVTVSSGDTLKVNGEMKESRLCMTTVTEQSLWFGQYYWYFLLGALAVLMAYLLWLNRCAKKGRSCFGLRFLNAMHRYHFLIQQLVDRDFKTKYKRSVLGVFWSFLNPLLTMLVQYVVFSTLFKTDILNYPAYLLIGIVCFSYFSETVSQCMMSIVGNAPLITKVYVPKYIYPLSKSLSSGINLLLSLIPLLGVLLLTGLWPKPAFLLLPFGLICLYQVSLGLGMILASLMVFFRDTQFLWGVVSMLWMYGTPIFYPESIIPSSLMGLYKMNPLYHVIRFCRSVLIDGISPEPKAYLLCFLACAVPLALGLWVFKRQQDKFILYI